MFDLFFGIGGRKVSIVLTVLANIFVACTNCQKGANFFHAWNPILHIWAMEHFKRHPSTLDSLPLDGHNWIAAHHKRVDGSNGRLLE